MDTNGKEDEAKAKAKRCGAHFHLQPSALVLKLLHEKGADLTQRRKDAKAQNILDRQ